MTLDSLRRHAVIPAVTGLALAFLASCTTSTHAGPAPSATIPPSALALPAPGDVAAGLARIRAATAKENQPTGQWAHYRDDSGTIWYFWPLPDGRLCTAREFRLPDDSDTREVGCTSSPLPGDGTPAVQPLNEASTHGGHWVTFLYADQEEITDLACGDQRLSAERFGRFGTAFGHRIVYAVPTPWLPVGLLHARVRHADGTTAPEEVKLPEKDPTPRVSYEHGCT
ncbi:hypothetical protein [Kitasatospora sp. NPDC093558]|uniref:hypothetical protein n=1 Tax=Kitasatospora sp. NPDC093558 TaxID=3155201 RepID=UPI00344254A4